jgi:hypothetical protein
MIITDPCWAESSPPRGADLATQIRALSEAPDALQPTSPDGLCLPRRVFSMPPSFAQLHRPMAKVFHVYFLLVLLLFSALRNA